MKTSQLFLLACVISVLGCNDDRGALPGANALSIQFEHDVGERPLQPNFVHTFSVDGEGTPELHVTAMFEYEDSSVTTEGLYLKEGLPAAVTLFEQDTRDLQIFAVTMDEPAEVELAVTVRITSDWCTGPDHWMHTQFALRDEGSPEFTRVTPEDSAWLSYYFTPDPYEIQIQIRVLPGQILKTYYFDYNAFWIYRPE